MKIKFKKKSLLFIFFNFQKIGSGGSVKRKIKKKLWPNHYHIYHYSGE